MNTTLQIYYNLIQGKYVNFQVCEYYGDLCFVELSKIVFSVVTMHDVQELQQYKGLYFKVFEVCEAFTKLYSNTMFLHFDSALSVAVLQLLTYALQDDTLDVLSNACPSLANMFTFAF